MASRRSKRVDVLPSDAAATYTPDLFITPDLDVFEYLKDEDKYALRTTVNNQGRLRVNTLALGLVSVSRLFAEAFVPNPDKRLYTYAKLLSKEKIDVDTVVWTKAYQKKVVIKKKCSVCGKSIENENYDNLCAECKKKEALKLKCAAKAIQRKEEVALGRENLDKELKIIEALSNSSVLDVAKRFGIGQKEVADIVARSNLIERNNKILAGYSEGMTIKTIADSFDISIQRCQQIIKAICARKINCLSCGEIFLAGVNDYFCDACREKKLFIHPDEEKLSLIKKRNADTAHLSLGGDKDFDKFVMDFRRGLDSENIALNNNLSIDEVNTIIETKIKTIKNCLLCSSEFSGYTNELACKQCQKRYNFDYEELLPRQSNSTSLIRRYTKLAPTVSFEDFKAIYDYLFNLTSRPNMAIKYSLKRLQDNPDTSLIDAAVYGATEFNRRNYQ